MARARLSPSLIERDWSVVQSLDRDYWAGAFARSGPQTAYRASVALWRHMRRLRPDWPTPADREADVERHVSIKRMLARTAHVAAR